MTNQEFIELSTDLLKYNYRINGSDRREFLNTIKNNAGALEQAKSLFGDRGTYYVSHSDLQRFVRDMKQGRKADYRNYNQNYSARADVYEVKTPTRQDLKNYKG